MSYKYSNCSGLTSLTIGNSVTSIGLSTFYGCNGLESIIVEEGNLYYDSREGCNAIIRTADNELVVGCKNTFIPTSVTSIGSSAFFGCSGLTSLTIGNSVTSIGSSAFSDCSGLTSLTIGNSVTSIDDYAFSGCSGLESIIVEEGNLYYDSRENCNAIIRTSDNALIVGCKNTLIPNSVTSIGSGAFYGCSGLIELSFPNSVTSIGVSAFWGCSGLTELTIGNSVTSIGDNAFRGCSGLTALTIPNSVTSIGIYAFLSCTELTSIILLCTIPPTITSIGAFESTTYQNATLYVPAGCKDVYQQAEGWKEFFNIQENALTDEEPDGGDDDTDGIGAVNISKDGANVIYTINGKRLHTTTVSNLPAGIYIVNGKKVVVK